MNTTKPTNLKPFDAAKFVSNDKTPTFDQYGQPVHVITTQGRGEHSIIGYIDDSPHVSIFKPESLRFEILKITACADVYISESGDIAVYSQDMDLRLLHGYVKIGTIKGEVEV